MTVQEAIEAIQIKEMQIECKATRMLEFCEGLAMAEEALEKQIKLEEVVARLEELFKYNSEQADVYMDGDDLYMREKKEMYMDRANCFGVAIRLVKEGMG